MSLSSKLGKDFRERKRQLGNAKLFMAISIVIIVLSTIWIAHTAQRVGNSYKTTGTVIKLVPKSPSNTLVTPLISYVDINGKSHAVKGKWYSGDPKYKKGDKLLILYRKEDSSQMQIGGFWNLYGYQIGLLGFGILTFLFSAIGYKYTKELIPQDGKL